MKFWMLEERELCFCGIFAKWQFLIFWIFFSRNHFLEGDFIFQWAERGGGLFFSWGGFIFKWGELPHGGRPSYIINLGLKFPALNVGLKFPASVMILVLDSHSQDYLKKIFNFIQGFPQVLRTWGAASPIGGGGLFKIWWGAWVNTWGSMERGGGFKKKSWDGGGGGAPHTPPIRGNPVIQPFSLA